MKVIDCCKYAPKSSIKAGEAISGGQYMFFTSSSDESKRYSDYLLDGEGIIMGTGGNATLHYYSGKFAVSTDCVVLLPDERIRCKYLFYFFLANMEVLERGFKGAGLKHTNKQYIGDIELGEIPSLQEQDKVIEIMDKVYEVISTGNEQVEDLDTLIKSRFVEMFGDTVTNSKNWEEHMLSEYIMFLTSGSRGWAQYFTNDCGEVFITIKNVKNNHISLENVQYIKAPNNKEAERTKVQSGDLLISITADLGRTGVVDDEIANMGAYINQHLSLVRLDCNKINPLYVSYYLETEGGKRQFESKNQNGVKAGLNFDAIKSLRILVPDRNLQEEYLEFVEQTDKLKVA